jgi:hypothetical protein
MASLLRKFCFIILFASSAQNSFASLDLGVGLSSAMSGRFIPAITATFLASGWAVSGSANGVQSGYYYHSIYTLNYYRTWSSGQMFGGNVNSGFGGGLSYSVRGFEDVNADLKEASDVVIGPSFFVRLDYGNTVFINTEMIWGLREIFNHIALNAQDVIVFSIGAQLW